MPSQSRSARQLPRTRGSQVYARGWRLNSGKANLKSGFSCRMSTVKGAAFSLSPRRGDVAQRQGGHIKRVAGCAAEALPAAETAEAEQGTATVARRAGEGNNKQCEGRFLRTSPRRGTLSFVTQKFFCFGAINNRRNYWLGISFLLSHRMGVYPDKQAVSEPGCPLYQPWYGAPQQL